MIPLRLDEIAEVVGGRLADPADAGVRVTGAAYVDSRDAVPGGLFVAVVGEHVDGHDYADGAHAVLGSRPTAAPTVVVDDPVRALGTLARHVLGRSRATVIALTGSQGKTGTKDFLAGALAAVAGSEAVVATRANHNNELGVPLTVLRADEATRYLVVEMGARGVGHIGYLCRIAPPDVAAVLNVGSAHIGEFGSREAIAQAKGEIVEALGPDGVAVLNADDPLVTTMARRTAARVLRFGAAPSGPPADSPSDTRPAPAEVPAVTWRDLRLDDRGRASFVLAYDDPASPAHPAGGTAVAVSLRPPGAHQVANAAAAVALAVGAGADFAAVAGALGDLDPPSRWRMEVTERRDGLLVVNDAYNANPESATAALEALAAMGAGGRRTVAVLGEMKELGDQHDAGHRAVGVAAARLGIDVVVVVGEAAAAVADGARQGAGGATAGVANVISTRGRSEAVDWLVHNAGPEDVVLVKASRGAALERVAAALTGALEDHEEAT